jgi:hypothetical protein
VTCQESGAPSAQASPDLSIVVEEEEHSVGACASGLTVDSHGVARVGMLCVDVGVMDSGRGLGTILTAGNHASRSYSGWGDTENERTHTHPARKTGDRFSVRWTLRDGLAIDLDQEDASEHHEEDLKEDLPRERPSHATRQGWVQTTAAAAPARACVCLTVGWHRFSRSWVDSLASAPSSSSFRRFT